MTEDPIILKLNDSLRRHEEDSNDDAMAGVSCSTSILRDELLLLLQEVAIEYTDRAKGRALSPDQYLKMIKKRFEVK